MLQKIEQIDGYRYITTTFKISEDKDFLENALGEAAERSRKVAPYAPSGRYRSPIVRNNKNVGGLLAEKAFRIYIENLREKRGANMKIVDSEMREETVEEIGTQIDFLLEVNGKQKSIEVRSSFSYRTNFPRLFGIPLYDGKGAFSIIGWYQHAHKPSEPKKDYYIFAIHFYHPNLIRQKCQNEVTVYIAGAASRKTLEDKGYDDDLKQRGALYRVINPLISVEDPVDVVDEMLEI